MPELPEVETVSRQLRRTVAGARIRAVRVAYPKAVAPLSPAAFSTLIVGSRITDVRRRAKMILIHLSNRRTLVAHLKMTGKFLIRPRDSRPGRFTEVMFDLGDAQLHYDDTRRFGWVKLIATEDVPALFRHARIGPEPLSPDFAAADFGARLRSHSRRTIKAALLDQTCIAGVGNIYADESLWRAGIRPTRRCRRLAVLDMWRLHRALRDVLGQAVKARGSSIVAFRDVFDRPGGFVPDLHAYGREGTLCDRGDGGVIKKIIVSGRGTHFCPTHQR